jgi:hypothetical protein
VRGRYYNSTVAGVNADGTFNIDYEDGDQDFAVEASRIAVVPWVRGEQSGYVGGSDSSDDDDSDGSDGSEDNDEAGDKALDDGDEALDALDALLHMAVEDRRLLQEERYTHWLARCKNRVDPPPVDDPTQSDTERGATEGGAAVSAAAADSSAGVAATPVPGAAGGGMQFVIPASAAAGSTPEPALAKPRLMRSASQDPVLRDMSPPGGRPFKKDEAARAASFTEHKAKFRAYALQRYQELQRYRQEGDEAADETGDATAVATVTTTVTL